MSKKKAAPAKEESPVVVAVKGFNKDLCCTGGDTPFQYEVGKTYEHKGEVEACSSGFHACTNPLDVFRYYEPGISRFCLVELSGEMSRHDEDSKIAAARITIKAELSLPEVIAKAIECVTALCKPADSHHATGYSSASSATGNRSASSATGNRSASSATGNRSASSATGNSSASSATGDSSASSATGYRSASSATGDRSASSATGDRSASSATGYRSASSATGDRSASSATGDSSASSATGDSSASSATGYRSASSATGIAAVALNTGRYGRARGSKDAAIVLCFHNDDGTLRHIRASKVGENGVKADTWYTLTEAGEFAEVE